MPKVAVSSVQKVRNFVEKYPNEFTCSGKSELYCKICSCVVASDKKFSVNHHRDSQKHKNGIIRNDNFVGKQSSQTFLNFKSSKYSEKLVISFSEANIPLYKLTHPSIKGLFSDLGVSIPSQPVCRQLVMKNSNEVILKVKQKLSNKLIFLVVDESEIRGIKYLNILAGLLEEPNKVYLIKCISLDKSPSAQTIIHKIDDSLKEFEIERENFCLLLSDAARYMTSAGSTLKKLYPNLFHVTCIAHLLHNCALQIRSYYSDIDNLIARMKAATVKNKERKARFEEIGAPPEPILTRWASWLNAAFYYAEHFSHVKKIVEQFDDDGVIVEKAKQSVVGTHIPKQLAAIFSNYKEIASLVPKIEATNFTIAEAFEIMSSMKFGEDICEIKSYIENRIMKNDILEIMNFSRPEVSPMIYALLQKCQPTTASVERSFSMLNKMLCKDRNFLPENVEKYFVLYFNNCENLV